MNGRDGYIYVFARNCEVRRVERTVIEKFIDKYHPLKYTNCKFRYGVFVAKEGHSGLEPGTLVACATFARPRKWNKGGRIIRSYEWVRYVSPPNVRVVGGMGKVLSHFVGEENPDDIMTYVDADHSDGDSYKQLGFVEELEKKFGNGTRSLKLRLKLTDYDS